MRDVTKPTTDGSSEPQGLLDHSDELTRLGLRLRTARRQQNLTLAAAADRAGVSKSFLSQVESGLAHPSLTTLKRISSAVKVPMWALFADPAEDDDAGGALDLQLQEVRVVRAARRIRLQIPDTHADVELLTPDVQHNLEVTLSVIQPGDGYGLHDAYRHPGEEFGLVLQGRYEVTVANEVFLLEPGDAIYLPGELAHRTLALGPEPVHSLWINTPPKL